MSELHDALQKSKSVFKEIRQEGRFCDAVIRIDGVEFHIHKIILCNCSLYFRTLFEDWSSEDRRYFDDPGPSPDTMELLIEFAYTGAVVVTEDNVEELMLAADMLKTVELLQTCSDFLIEKLCPDNCIGFWKFSDVCNSSELGSKAFRCITDHFEEVALGEEFLQLSSDNLAEILDRDDLNVKMESTVFEAILRWITHKPEERTQDIAMLFPKARLALTSIDYINAEVMSNELVKKNPECKKLVRRVVQTLKHMSRHSSTTCEVYNLSLRPRLPRAVLMVTGGWNRNQPLNIIQAFDNRADSWTFVFRSMPYRRAYHGSAVLGGFLYCIGGFDRVQNFSSVARFDLSRHTWSEVAGMHSRRNYVSVAALDGYLYAIGGYDGRSRLRSAERYRARDNQWSRISDMNDARGDGNCAPLHGKIYICGGFNGSEILYSAECYDPEVNQWTLIPSMGCRRSGLGVTAFADSIYVVGGFDGNIRLKSVESYHPPTNTWHLGTPMLNPRSNFGLGVIDEQLFVIGGFNGVSTTNKVERFDGASSQWYKACDLSVPCSAISSCVVSGIPNIVDYTVSREPFVPAEERV